MIAKSEITSTPKTKPKERPVSLIYLHHQKILSFDEYLRVYAVQSINSYKGVLRYAPRPSATLEQNTYLLESAYHAANLQPPDRVRTKFEDFANEYRDISTDIAESTDVDAIDKIRIALQTYIVLLAKVKDVKRLYNPCGSLVGAILNTIHYYGHHLSIDLKKEIIKRMNTFYPSAMFLM